MPCPAPSGWRVLLGLVVPPGAGSQEPGIKWRGCPGCCGTLCSARDALSSPLRLASAPGTRSPTRSRESGAEDALGVVARFVATAMPCPAPSGLRVPLGLVVPPGARNQVERMPRVLRHAL
ncbi:hypothetical protein NDU88_002941 [Pleurodeles waltl]|uniref:Secreted protein n=1 Tax=Pleurodeles waltl TaxID=8319 RepID=A0AAV7W3W1_PLEWA|nr:hypothetical protein NDU88_002941 [Pleurodeles waltl]